MNFEGKVHNFVLNPEITIYELKLLIQEKEKIPCCFI